MIHKKAILVVSYGSSFKDARERSIGAIEEIIGQRFPDYKVYRAFTSESIIQKIKEKENLQIDTVSQALERIVSDGIKDLTIIQTHLLQGMRHESLLNLTEVYRNQFVQFKVAEPILKIEENVEAFAEALENVGGVYDDGKTAICCIGHGIDMDTNEVYRNIQSVLEQKGLKNYYVGTLSVKPTLEDLYDEIVAQQKYERVVLLPLMLVSGYHVRKDLAGPSEGSWRNVFAKSGFKVECIMKSLGENSIVQNILATYTENVIFRNI